MVKAKILENSRTKQLFIALPKRKFKVLKDKKPKFVHIHKEDFEF